MRPTADAFCGGVGRGRRRAYPYDSGHKAHLVALFASGLRSAVSWSFIVPLHLRVTASVCVSAGADRGDWCAICGVRERVARVACVWLGVWIARGAVCCQAGQAIC